MNIAFFSDAYSPQLNGIATNIEAVAGALERRGHSVSIFAPRMGEYVDQRPRVYRRPSVLAAKDPPMWLASPLSLKLPAETAGRKFDIVHVHTPFAMQFLGLAVARRAGIPLVSTYHTLLTAQVHHAQVGGRQFVSPRLAENYSAWTCNLCDQIIAPSAKIKTALDSYGVRPTIDIVRNGVALDRFQHGTRGYLRRRFGLPADARIMLAVGRLTADKNFGFLIPVLARAAARDKHIYLVIVGQGPLKAEFEQTAERLGVRANLILAGPVDPIEMPAVYADADLYVTSSLSEVQSVAALEALATGLPFVVVRDRSFDGIVVEGQNGFAAAPDVDAFAARVLEIAAEPAMHERMSQASRMLSAGFTIEAQAQRLEQVYRAASISMRASSNYSQHSPERASARISNRT